MYMYFILYSRGQSSNLNVQCVSSGLVTNQEESNCGTAFVLRFTSIVMRLYCLCTDFHLNLY